MRGRGGPGELSEVGGLRIIAGSLKGRRLEAPSWEGLRPTSDKLRETLFNVLAPRIPKARVLDAFAGTGALGIEAWSRGAAEVLFIDHDPRARRLVAENLARCGIAKGCAIMPASIVRAARTRPSPARGASRLPPFDIVLLDPPYELPPDKILEDADPAVAPCGIAVLEHSRRQRAPEAAGRLVLVRQITSGNSTLSFYKVRASNADASEVDTFSL